MNKKQSETQTDDLQTGRRVARAYSTLLKVWEKSIALSVELEGAIQLLEKSLPAESGSRRRFEESLLRVDRMLSELVVSGSTSKALATQKKRPRKKNPEAKRLQRDYLYLLNEYRAFQEQEIRDYGQRRIGPKDWLDYKIAWHEKADRVFDRYWRERYSAFDPEIALSRIISYAQAIERRNRLK